MENNTGNAKTDKIIFWAVCLILLLPIAVLPPSFLPSDWSRTILFRTALVLLISFLFFKFFYKKEFSISLPAWNVSDFMPLLAFLAFFAVLVVSTFFSQDIRFSFFGSPSRAGGILNLFFYAVFAVFIAVFLKKQQWEKLWIVLFSSGILASLIAFLQYFGLAREIFVSREGGNTPSLLGNSTFLAIYMLFLSILSLIMFIKEQNRNKKIVLACLFCTFAFTIFTSGSRATYIAFAFSLLYFFLFLPASESLKISQRLKIARIAIISLMAVLLILIAYANLAPKLPGFIEKDARLSYLFHNRLSLSTLMRDLTGARFAAWQITFQAIKEKPLLGWGPENFYIGFEKYYDPLLGDIKKTWWDRPHNVFLETWANSGIFALILYAGFWLAMLWMLQKSKRQSQFPAMAHGIQAMFLGYLAVLFFNFDSFSSYLISFLFIGYSFYLYFENKEKIFFLPPKKGLLSKKPALIILIILIIAFAWSWDIKPLYANEQIVYIQNLPAKDKCATALNTMGKIWENAGILKAYSGLKYSDLLKDCAQTSPEKEIEYSKKGLEALKSSSEFQPNFTRTWLFMGGLANVLAAKENSQDSRNSYLSEAKGYLDKALRLSPKRQEILIEMEKNYLVSADYEAMKKTAQDCIEIDDYWGECYWYLGVAEVFLGNQEIGKKYVAISEEKGYGRPPFMQLASAFLSQKNYKDAAYVYRQIVFYYPENADYHATMAFLYKEIGQYSDAAMEALAVLELQPENSEAAAFIKEMLALSPYSANSHYAWGMACKIMGDNEQKIKELKIALALYEQHLAQGGNNFYSQQVEKIKKELGYGQ